ncbi:hypothetical protein AB6A40_003808 [Gnathostoma spinigerum]|uniref:Uncharacterized protein n=1 Tax=Gnathostoma spinigerum TaxID=75299 RepID=A0ABD6EAL1_9BILA
MGCQRSKMWDASDISAMEAEVWSLKIRPQRDDVMLDLDTDNDRAGRIAVDHIFRRTRDVYGQRAEDLMYKPINWEDYGIVFTGRPNPRDFPAFAQDRVIAAEAEKVEEQEETQDKNPTVGGDNEVKIADDRTVGATSVTSNINRSTDVPDEEAELKSKIIADQTAHP